MPAVHNPLIPGPDAAVDHDITPPWPVPVMWTARQFTSWLSRRPELVGAGRVIVTGDRRWTDPRTIFERLRQLPPDTIVIQGGATGADAIARDCCAVLRLQCIEFPANWAEHGRAAGPRRNEVMLDCDPHLVMAFHRQIRFSRGTRHMALLAYGAGVVTEVHDGSSMQRHDPADRPLQAA